jgi:hypothetical protein
MRDFAWASVKLFAPAAGAPGLFALGLATAGVLALGFAEGAVVCANAPPAPNQDRDDGRSQKLFHQSFPKFVSLHTESTSFRRVSSVKPVIKKQCSFSCSLFDH